MNIFYKSSIMIIDDSEMNIDILVETLGHDYAVSVFTDAGSALEEISSIMPDLILLDIKMPGMSGYELCVKLKQKKDTQHIPIIFLSGLTSSEDEEKGLMLGAVDYITKPFNPLLVRSRVRNQIELKRYRYNLEELIKQRTHELELTQDITIECMASIAEHRDIETGMHIQRTKRYVKILCEELKKTSKYSNVLTSLEIELIIKSAPLHDVGKVGIPDDILFKKGKLTEEEFNIMKTHTIIGKNAIAASEKKIKGNSFLRYAIEIAESHHEKWNGSGYPYGLKGEKIFLSARIMALADVYDALVTERIYKPAFSHEKAIEIIKEAKGSHFDPDIVDAFLKVQEEFKKVLISSKE